jgi:exopolyphosphatase/pppGpp-phosphohydrolase
LDRVRLLHLPGMDDKRVDLILPGALILDEVCQALGVQKVRSTEATLRDGLLAEALQNPALRD